MSSTVSEIKVQKSQQSMLSMSLKVKKVTFLGQMFFFQTISQLRIPDSRPRPSCFRPLQIKRLKTHSSHLDVSCPLPFFKSCTFINVFSQIKRRHFMTYGVTTLEEFSLTPEVGLSFLAKERIFIHSFFFPPSVQ